MTALYSIEITALVAGSVPPFYRNENKLALLPFFSMVLTQVVFKFSPVLAHILFSIDLDQFYDSSSPFLI